MRQAPKESKRCRQSNEISQLQHLAAFYSSHRFSEDSCVIKKKKILKESRTIQMQTFMDAN